MKKLFAALAVLALGTAEARQWMVPAAAHATGANDTNWRTDLRLATDSTSPVTATVTLLPRDADNSALSQSIQVTARIHEMVGESVFRKDIQADGPQRSKEFLRQSDPREGNAFRSRSQGIRQFRSKSRAFHRNTLWNPARHVRVIAPHHKNGIGTPHRRRKRFAHRSGGHYAAVSKPVAAINDDQGKILVKRWILEPVIQQDQLRARIGGRPCAGDPVLRDPGLGM